MKCLVKHYICYHCKPRTLIYDLKKWIRQFGSSMNFSFSFKWCLKDDNCCNEKIEKEGKGIGPQPCIVNLGGHLKFCVKRTRQIPFVYIFKILPELMYPILFIPGFTAVWNVIPRIVKLCKGTEIVLVLHKVHYASQFWSI